MNLVRPPAAIICVLLVSWLSAPPAGATAPKSPPFYPISKKALKVPKGVQPWLPTWTPDGSHVVFQNQIDGTTWVTSRKGKGTKCITCGFADRPQIFGGFTYAFSDNKRLFLSHELGSLGGADSGPNADAFILECEPAIYICTSHSYLPVDMAEDKVGNPPLIVQRRTWHLAPDEVHLGWMDLRLDGTVMIVGRLERGTDSYKVVDQKTVNPPGPASLTDSAAQGWINNNQLYELKSFADGGASIIAVGGPDFNVDALKINLASGKITRLTRNPDWDEDGAFSPDGKLYALYSWRTRHRIEAAGWIPQIQPFTEMPEFAALAPYYVSTWQGFQCDLSPWLLTSAGDGGGKLVGQPLNVYPGKRLTPGNNLSGQQFWSPDSTSVLLQERLRKQPPPGLNEHVEQKGLVPNRIMIAHIDRKPAKAKKVVSSEVGNWAQAPGTYFGTTGSNTTITVHGKAGGTADLAYSGNLAEGSWTATYNAFTQDGKTFVDGTYAVTSTNTGSFWTIDADVTVTGQHTGSLKASLIVNNGHTPLPEKSGTFRAVYDGKPAPPLPELGPCYGKLPRASKLRARTRLRARAGADLLSVRVTANVYGDLRPVRNASVRIAGRKALTNANGEAVLRLRGSGARALVVTAGDTFVALRRTVRLP